MNPFWTGFLLGWVLFIPSVVAGGLLILWGYYGFRGLRRRVTRVKG